MARPQTERCGCGRTQLVGWAAFLLRCTAGVTFLAHEIQKIVILGWVGGVPKFPVTEHPAGRDRVCAGDYR